GAAEVLAELVLPREPQGVVLGDVVEGPLGGAVEVQHGAARVRARLDDHVGEDEDVLGERLGLDPEAVPGRRVPPQAGVLELTGETVADHPSSVPTFRPPRRGGGGPAYCPAAPRGRGSSGRTTMSPSSSVSASASKGARTFASLSK